MTDPDSAFAPAAGLLGRIAGRLTARLAEVRPYGRRQEKYQKPEQHQTSEEEAQRP
ncbi:hypothetical protein [Streptomyces sp. NPDC002463]|uniref:hypothetical protein n=1 Tax=Streptomyces sp. NPDC002463 TaxID=3364645 RepID=UPI0036755006